MYRNSNHMNSPDMTKDVLKRKYDYIHSVNAIVHLKSAIGAIDVSLS